MESLLNLHYPAFRLVSFSSLLLHTVEPVVLCHFLCLYLWLALPLTLYTQVFENIFPQIKLKNLFPSSYSCPFTHCQVSWEISVYSLLPHCTFHSFASIPLLHSFASFSFHAPLSPCTVLQRQQIHTVRWTFQFLPSPLSCIQCCSSLNPFRKKTAK